MSILIAYSSNAGDSKKKKFHSEIKFGAEAGLNLPKIIFSEQNGSNPNSLFATAWHVGGYTNIKMTDKFSFQLELLYSVKGDKVTNPLGGSEYFIYQYDYIEMPIQIKYNICNHFTIVGGLYTGYLIAFSSNVTNTTYSYAPNTSYYDSFNKLDIGATLGIGYQLNDGFNIAIKYSQGFTSIVPTQDSNGNPIISEYNMVFSLCLGWTFK